MKFNINFETKTKNTFRTDVLKAQYDLKDDIYNQTFEGELKIGDKPWNIGLICGSSGSGKSTIANQCFKDQFWPHFEYKEDTFIDDFNSNLKPDDIFGILSNVGFAAPPLWLKKYSHLSNGQKMRVDLARAIIECPEDKTIIFDEFTSVVNRQVAQIGSNAVQKYIRKKNKKFIAVSCHSDILEWLQPDWVYDTDKKKFFFAKNSLDQKLNAKLENAANYDGPLIESFTI